MGWRWNGEWSWRKRRRSGRSSRPHSPFLCELSSVKSPISPPATPTTSPPRPPHPPKTCPKKIPRPQKYGNLNCTKASSCFVVPRLSSLASHQLPIIPSLCALEYSLSLHSTFCAFVCEGRRGRRGRSGARKQSVRTYVRWLLINLDAASTILIGRRGRR